jgi:hypothetical protein
MVSVPELGVVVYVSTNETGRVATLGIQSMSDPTVLYFAKDDVVRAIRRGAVLKVAYNARQVGSQIGRRSTRSR